MPPKPQPNQSLTYLVWQLNRRHQRAVSAVLSKWQLSYCEFLVLDSLNRDFARQITGSQSYLTHILSLSPMQTSRLMRSLDVKRLIIKQRTAFNYKSFNVRLSAQGRKTLWQASSAMRQLDKHLAERLTKIALKQVQ